MSVKYKSTRGKQVGLSFEEVVLGGLATDKGLFIPETVPTFTLDEIEKVHRKLCSLSALNILFKIFSFICRCEACPIMHWHIKLSQNL